MSIFHLLIVFGIPAAVIFVFFQKGARKVGKNPLAWGAIGGITYIVAMMIAVPIFVDKSVDALGRTSGSLFFAYSALAFALSIGAAILVYKKVMLKP